MHLAEGTAARSLTARLALSVLLDGSPLLVKRRSMAQAGLREGVHQKARQKEREREATWKIRNPFSRGPASDENHSTQEVVQDCRWSPEELEVVYCT